MDFVAMDVETANSDLASICQIGIVVFAGGEVIDTWHSLVNPEDYFDPWNIAVHGIDEKAVLGAPKIPEIHQILVGLIGGRVVAHHTAFDKNAIGKVLAKYRLPEVDCTWLDTAKVARRTWPAYAASGYGLAKIAADLGIKFRHHIAHEDARASGEILVRASTIVGLSVTEWTERVGQPISPASAADVSRKGNADGALAGETVVFTGTLSLSRQQAADMAAEAGCDVASGVNKTTTLLVVGDQDMNRLAGQEKSTKHRKAEELRAKGQAIRIIVEGDFLRLVGKGTTNGGQLKG